LGKEGVGRVSHAAVVVRWCSSRDRVEGVGGRES
jgi:hypothetical protein